MDIFALQVDYDARGNSPWGTLHDEADLDDTRPLWRNRPLAPTWRPMPARLYGARAVSDFVSFTAGGWAVRAEARRALEPLLGDNAEFLPLDCDPDEGFHALHPLQLADLGPEAVVRRNEVSGNITVIDRYSFEPSTLVGMVCFRARHPPGSAAGPHSGTSDVLVSQPVRECIEQHGFRGVRCVQVAPVDTRPYR